MSCLPCCVTKAALNLRGVGIIGVHHHFTSVRKSEPGVVVHAYGNYNTARLRLALMQKRPVMVGNTVIPTLRRQRPAWAHTCVGGGDTLLT